MLGRDQLEKGRADQFLGRDAQQPQGGRRRRAVTAVQADPRDHVGGVVRQRAIAAFSAQDRGLRLLALRDVAQRTIRARQHARLVMQQADAERAPADAQLRRKAQLRLPYRPLVPQRRDERIDEHLPILGQHEGHCAPAQALCHAMAGDASPGVAEKGPAAVHVGFEDDVLRPGDNAPVPRLAALQRLQQLRAPAELPRQRQRHQEGGGQVELEELELPHAGQVGHRDRAVPGRRGDAADQRDENDRQRGAGPAQLERREQDRQRGQEQQRQLLLAEGAGRNRRDGREQQPSPSP